MGGSSLEHRGKESSTEIVKLIRGDEWVTSAENHISKIDFIKIDVEGHEPNVLKGLKNTLLNHRPIVMLEYNEEPTVQAFKEMDLFNCYFASYEVFVLGNNYDRKYHESKGNTKLRRFFTRLMSKKIVKLYSFIPSRAYHNILIVPKEKLSLLPRECLT